MAYRWRRGAMMSETTYRNLVENGYLAAFAPEQSDRFVCPDEKRPGHRGRTPKQSQKRVLIGGSKAEQFERQQRLSASPPVGLNTRLDILEPAPRLQDAP